MNKGTVKQKYFDPAEGMACARYLQLRNGFSAWIHDCEHGTELPSERELSTLLGVNRRTLRQALEPFLASGNLVRKGYKTFVNHKIGAYPEQLSPSGQPIKIMLFEGSRSSKSFWEQIIAEFNCQMPEYELQLNFYPEDDQGVEKYWQDFESDSFDLAVLPVSYRWKKETEQHLLPVKDSMKKYLHSDEFLIGTFTESSAMLRDYAYPYLFTFQMAQYRKPYHVLNGHHVKELSFEDILRYAVKEIPLEFPLFNIYYDICRDLGAMAEVTSEVIREHCEIILDRLDVLKGRKHAFAVTGFVKKGWSINRADKLFCCHQFSGELLNRNRSEQMENTVFHPRKGSLYWGGCGSVGICRNSENHPAALLFVEFLISEQVQNMIWEKFRSAPVRVSSLASVDIAPAGELLLYLRSCRENPKSYPPPVGSVMLPYFEQYLSGSVTREKILENILRFYI